MLKPFILRPVWRKPPPLGAHPLSITRLRLPSLRMASTLPKLPIFEAISKHDLSSTAVIDSGSNQAFSYGTLLRDVVAAKQHLSQTVSGSPLCGERVAFLAENGYNYVGK
jgi:malonyl-CoA/methylmalonyl-CoA synthetase